MAKSGERNEAGSNARGVRSLIGYDSPLGPMTLAECGGALVGSWFDGQEHDRADLGAYREAAAGEVPVLDEATTWLGCYFAGANPGSLPPTAPYGTTFQQAVWRELVGIPRGQTTTYGAIADRLGAACGRRASARAVGAAVARNPLLVFVPCHRVVGSDGGLTGYAAGLGRKEVLLALEGVRR
jgi:methylated-DNA-[protein]-cysteine S-methyltransferase